MNFTTLASGSSGNCYLLEKAGDYLMIEAGISFAKIKDAVWSAGLKLTQIDACLISHAHGDHSKAASDLLKSNMRVAMSEGCFNELGFAGRILPGGIQVIEPEKPIRFGPWEVNAFDVKHDGDGTLGFVIDHVPDGGRLAYVTDARFLGYRIPGVTTWAIEANYDLDILKRNIARGSLNRMVGARVIESHMSIDTAISALAANDLSPCERIYLIHLSDGNSHAEDFKARVKASTGVPCYIAGEKAAVA